MKLTIIGITDNPFTVFAIGEDRTRWFWGVDEDGKWDEDWVFCSDEPPLPPLVVEDHLRCKPHQLWNCTCEQKPHG